MLDKKQIWAIFLSSKWVIKQWRQLTVLTVHLAQKLRIDLQCSGGSERFTKEMRPWRWGAQWPASGSWQGPTERVIKADPLKTAREVAEEFTVDHSVVIRHVNQIGKVKKLNKWMPPELTSNKKSRHFEVSSLILHNNSKQFLNWIVTYDKKWILCDNQQQPAQWLE